MPILPGEEIDRGITSESQSSDWLRVNKRDGMLLLICMS